MKNRKEHEKSLKRHYDRPGLSDTLFADLDRAGKTITSYQDTAAFDEFHIRGREATAELAHLANLRPGQRLLDMGCGLGGPSRLLAAEFGCRVFGIDLAAEFMTIASRLTARVGLPENAAYLRADMLALPFRPNSFDVAWSQHTFMNIEQKSRILEQIHHVLKTGGRLALYEVLSGKNKPIHYPVQWAEDASLNFLMPQTEFINMLNLAGFETLEWLDVTDRCTRWFETVAAKMARRPKTAPPAMGLNMIIGPGAAQKARNTLRNLREHRIGVVYGVFEIQK